MGFTKVIFDILKAKMTTPQSYGWFHLLFCGLVVLVTVLLCVKFRKCNDKTFRKIVFIFWIVIVVFELYKQFVFNFSFDGESVSFGYQWYIFPFQFCSTPLYIFPLIVFLKDGKVREACISFASTFILVAGLSAYVMPMGIFVDWIGINIQTLVHHGTQIIVGIFICSYAKQKLSLKKLLGAIIVFAVMVLIALLLDVLFYNFVTKDTFNMFFISPYFPEGYLVVLIDIYQKTNYIVFLICYIFAFSLASFVIYGVRKGIEKLTKLKARN